LDLESSQSDQIKESTMAQWQLQDAKARFSELVRAAREQGPQTVTVRGESAVVVLSQRQYRSLQLRAKQPSLAELMRNSPLVGVELDVQRDRSPTRSDAFTLDQG
jgi:antitoxin Phd